MTLRLCAISADKANLVIRQKKQFFDGSIQSPNSRTIHFEDGRINGNRLEFDYQDGATKYSFKGQITAGQLTGILNNDPKLQIVAKRAAPQLSR